MASATYTVKCSANNHPFKFALPNLKTTPLSVKLAITQEPKKSTIKTEASRVIKTTSSTLLNAFANSVFQFINQPMLPSQKNFAPVEEIGELVKVDCSQGKLPGDFPEGIYIRNGANPLFGGLKFAVSMFGKTDSIWVEGEGMLHALNFTRDAQKNWSLYYKNRFVETETYKMERQQKRPSFLPVAEGDPLALLASSFFNTLRFSKVNKILSNTSVFEHGGKHYSSAENDVPQEIDLISLKTFDNWNVNGAWSRPFTAHPKKAPGTEELVIVGFEPKKPYCVIGVISADGKELKHKLDLRLDHCSIFHEIGVTNKYNILIDCMITLSTERVMKGGQLFKYEREKDAKIAVIPRYGDADSIKWFNIEPCCSYHLVNTFEDGDEVVVRGCTSKTPILPGPDWGEDKSDWFARGFNFKPIEHLTNMNGGLGAENGMLFTKIREWRLNMVTHKVKEKDVTGTEYSMDFPFINEHFTGLKHKYGYTQVIDSVASSKSARTKYGKLAKLYFEEESKKQNMHGEVNIEYHHLPKNNFCTGSTFVTKPGAVEEDDGWIVTFAHDEDNDTSYVLVVDAKNIGDEPVAKINLPQRVPYGHHGSFFPST